jgi:hypothetical protein
MGRESITVREVVFTMAGDKRIYVALLNEGVDVWRPVRAEHLGGNLYRIVSQPYNREIEYWQFEPGDEVVCEMIESSEERILAATRKKAPGR